MPVVAALERLTTRQFVRRFELSELTATLALRNSNPMIEAMLFILNADDGAEPGVDLDDPDTIGFVNYLHFVAGTISSVERVAEILDSTR